ncbi:LOW QUALITY PROTEIN: hypothetical protein ACHAWF_001245, partial [Thalassiosira exigua]
MGSLRPSTLRTARCTDVPPRGDRGPMVEHRWQDRLPHHLDDCCVEEIGSSSDASQHPPPTSHLLRATVYMIIIAFFFLLRPGEYTDLPFGTTPFTLDAVQLFVGTTLLFLLTAPECQLLQARFSFLTFTEQKNGVRGEVIGLGCSGNPYLCPVKVLVVASSTCENAIPHTPLARVFNCPTSVTPSQITSLLHQTVCDLGTDLGFLPSDVSARCLRAAGVTALLNGKVDPDVICLVGHWCYEEMLRYFHVRAAPLMSDYAQ